MSVMTREQVDQLFEHADDCIRRALARLDVQGGPGVNVNGNLISVDMPEVIDEPRPEETWVLGIYAILTVTHSVTGEDVQPLRLAARWLVNTTGAILPTSIWSDTQIFETVPEDEESEPVSRSVRLEFFARSFEPSVPGASEDFENAIYRYPVQLVIEEVLDQPGPAVIVESYDLTVRRAGVSRTFLPVADRFTILRLASITRF